MNQATALVEFLKARLDEDYEAARFVLGINLMADYKRGKPLPRWVPSPEGDAGIWDTSGQVRVKFVWARERDHIVRHDPARVLWEVATTRRLIERYEISLDAPAPLDEHERGMDEGYRMACLALIREAAAVWSDHSDYRGEWRP